MKNTMIQIPILEAFENKTTECPICDIASKNENRLIERVLLDMVMNVEFNTRLGKDFLFCREHYTKLYSYKDKLSLAIMMEKIISMAKKDLKSFTNEFLNQAKPSKPSLFRIGRKLPEIAVSKAEKLCYICSSLETGMNDTLRIMLEMWRENQEFKSIYNSSKGFCIEHYKKIIELSPEVLTEPYDLKEFIETTGEIQTANLERLKSELSWFIEKSDYRFKDEPWKTSADSLPRSLEKIIGKFRQG